MEIEQRLSIYEWLKIPIDTRHQMVNIFKIPRSGGALVEDNVVKTDGYTFDDLRVITVDALQKFLENNSIGDFNLLVTEAVNRIKTAIQEERLKINEIEYYERLDKWINIVKEIRLQSKELGLQDKFDERIRDIFNVEEIKQKNVKKEKKQD